MALKEPRCYEETKGRLRNYFRGPAMIVALLVLVLGLFIMSDSCNGYVKFFIGVKLTLFSLVTGSVFTKVTALFKA